MRGRRKQNREKTGCRRKGMLACLGPRKIPNGSVKGLHGEHSSKMMMQQNLAQKMPASDDTG